MWNDNLVDRLETTKNMIQEGINLIKETPSKAVIVDLIHALKGIDGNYKYECEEIDELTGIEYNGKPLYEIGMNSEFDIGGLTWHKISLLLRQLDDNSK